MKVINGVIFIIFLLITIGCNNQPIGSGLDNVDPFDKLEGTLFIHLPKPINSRSVIDPTYASNNVNHYEAFIFNDSTMIMAELTNAPIAVPVGTYTVVVLAGYRMGTSTSLLGSGYLSDVIVVQDQRTDVEIPLRTPNITLSAPTEVIANRNFDLLYSGNLNNPYLSTPSSGNGAYYFNVGGSSQEVKYFSSGTVTNDSFSFIAHLTSPAVAQNLKISISVVYINLQGQSINWKMPEYYYTNINGVSEIYVNVIEDPTGIGLTLYWEE
jgi:hypothetical protein